MLITLALAGCNDAPAEAPTAEVPPAEAPDQETPEAEVPAAEPVADSGFTFGYMAYNLADMWNQFSMDAFVWCADMKGVEVLYVDAQSDTGYQATQAQEMIDLGVDAISIFPVTTEVGATVVHMANEAGIPIAVENIFMPDDESAGDIVGQIACRYSDVGYAAIEYAAGAFPECKMLWVQGAPGLGVTEDYKAGVDAALELYGDLVEIAGYVNGEFAMETAYKTTLNFIKSGREFDIIFAQNDLMAFGSFNALKERGMEDIPIISTGGSPQGYEMMQQGQQYANMTAPVNIQGVTIFDFLWRYVNGVSIPDNKIPLPIIPIDFPTIDQWIQWYDVQAAYDYIGGIQP